MPAACERFDATTGGLPVAPAGMRLRGVRFQTCPGELSIEVVSDVARTLDGRHGVSPDAWWVVRSRPLPDRVLRLRDGVRSLTQLLRRYGFLGDDHDACVHQRDAVAVFAPAAAALDGARALHHVPPHLRDSTGVPQFQPNSGVCWFAAFVAIAFGNADVRAWIIDNYMPDACKQHARDSLHSREAAEALRLCLWREFKIGDDVDHGRPEEDGCNGFAELALMLVRLGVPLVIYTESAGKFVVDTEPLKDHASPPNSVAIPPVTDAGARHLLALRYQDCDHVATHPIARRIEFGGRRYRLLGLFTGSFKCGHQTGTVCTGRGWRTLMLTDADQHKDGIGPTFVHFEGARWRGGEWWNALERLPFVTKYGAGHGSYCMITAHNRRDDALDGGSAARKPHRPGTTCVDVLYVLDDAP